MAYNNTGSASMSTTKKAFKILLLLFLIFVVVSLGTNTVNLISRGLVVREEGQELKALQEKNEQLRARLDYIKTDEFLEQEARNSLGLTKEETILILPQDILWQEEVGDQVIGQIPNWRQWWELFFKGGRGRT
jgi:cell division protein DivIC